MIETPNSLAKKDKSLSKTAITAKNNDKVSLSKYTITHLDKVNLYYYKIGFASMKIVIDKMYQEFYNNILKEINFNKIEVILY